MAPKVMKKPAASKSRMGKGHRIGQENLGGQIGQEMLDGRKGQGSLCGQTEGGPSFVANRGVLTTPPAKGTPGGVASPYYDLGTAHLVRQQGRVTVRSADGSLQPETSRLPRADGTLNRRPSYVHVADAFGASLDAAMMMGIAKSCGSSSR